MKLTEAKLKQLIKEVLEEGMKTIDDLPEGVFVKVEKTTASTIEVYFADETGFVVKYENESKPYGMISMDIETQLADDFPCLDAMMVAYSDAAQGWGPLLYDVSIEVATIMAGGLVSDRSIVSQDAYNVWDKYTKRDGVEKIQLDNEYDALTYPKDDPLKRDPIPFDNCLQNISYEYEEKTGIPWKESPLSKMYKKEPITLKALDGSKKLILTNINLNF